MPTPPPPTSTPPSPPPRATPTSSTRWSARGQNVAQPVRHPPGGEGPVRFLSLGTQRPWGPQAEPPLLAARQALSQPGPLQAGPRPHHEDNRSHPRRRADGGLRPAATDLT